MKTRYSALLRLIIEPVVWNVDATSGMALRMAVDEMGDRRPHHAIMATMMFLRWVGNLS